MKKIIFLLFLLQIGKLYAQIQHTGYFSPEIIYTTLDRNTAVFAGAKAMWVFNGTFGIGGSYYAVVNNVKNKTFDPLSNNYNLTQMSFGGVHLEYFFPGYLGLNHSIEMMCAGGGMKHIPQNTSEPHSSYYGSDMLVWMPRYNVQMDLSENWRLNLGIGYRHIGNFRGYFQYNRTNTSGFVLSLAVRGGNN